MDQDDLFSSEDARWTFILVLDDELLKGSVTVSEFAAEWIRNCDLCFTSGAYLACVITAFQAIETMLRHDGSCEEKSVELINRAPFPDSLKCCMHSLRRFRNSWVHVRDPWDDRAAILDFDNGNKTLFERSIDAVRLMRQVLYHNQGT